MDFDKDKIINAELRKLKRIAKNVPADKTAIANSLIAELAFMSGTLAELKEVVNTTGAIELFKQGSQEFLRENPALKSYNTTINRYSQLYKQLTDLLPKTDAKGQESELLDFLKEG